jgi:C-terminal processing protease CtpA/Prc
LRIVHVAADSPAEIADLAAGDRIAKIGGEAQ